MLNWQHIEATGDGGNCFCIIEDGDEYANELQKEFEDATAFTAKPPEVTSTSQADKSSEKKIVDKPDVVSNYIFVDLDVEENSAIEEDKPASHISD